MKRFWKSLGIAAAYFAVFLAIQFLISLAGTMILLGRMVSEQGLELFQDVDSFQRLLMAGMMESVTTLVLISNIVSVLGIWAFFALRRKKFNREIQLYRTTGRNLAMSVFFGIGMCFLMDLLTWVLPIPEDTMEQFQQQHGMLWFGDVGITFLSVALVGPLTEEIFFRGLCYTRMKRGMRPWLAGLLSSVLFGLAHGDPVWFLVGFVAGVSLSWIFETTGTLLCPMVVHVTNNAISSVTAYFPMSPAVHGLLILSSVVITGVSAWFLYRWNHIPPQKAET